MKYLSLLIVLLSFPLFSSRVFAANLNLELIEKTDYYTFKIIFTGLEKTACKDKTCYLQGMFSENVTRAKNFGFTFGQNDWFEYVASPDKEFINSNFVPFDTGPDGVWEGIIRLRPDANHSGYKGPGKYLVKIKRYINEENTNPATDEINELLVDIDDALPTPSVTETVTVSISPSPLPSPTQTPTPSITSTPTKAPTTIKTPTPIPIITSQASPLPSPKSSQANVTSVHEQVTLQKEAVLGDSTPSSEINLYINETTPSGQSFPADSSSDSQHSKYQPYKYVTLFGVLLATVSGGLLYFRFRRFKIDQ